MALLNDKLLPDGHRVKAIDSVGLWVEGKDGTWPLEELSDGYRNVVAICLDMIHTIAEIADRHPRINRQSGWVRFREGHPEVFWPGVVLIDEVELHLHVSWQKRLGDWLRDHFPQIQFIVTTHSPYVCQSASPGGLIRLPGPRDAFHAEVVDDDTYRRIVHGSGDDALLSELFGVDSVFSSATNKMRHEVALLERQIALGVESAAQRERYDELRLELESSPLSRVIELRPD